ncbi:MAG: glycosyltransferase family 52 [Cetobacterium sp.]|uniref:glycosyltransferase family 52 n=1 Tax=Cetobacterium sp. TaxID=2071632 RepID=UPI003F310E3B
MEGKIKGIDYICIREKRYKIRLLRKLYRIFSNFLVRRFFRKNKLQKLPVYGVDHWLWNGYIKRCHNVYIIEDGTINYDLKKQIETFKNISLLKRIRWWLYWKSPSLGLSKNVKKIYLTGIGPTPKEIEEKVEIINLQEKWNSLNSKEKKLIMEIFNVDDKNLKNIEKCEGILITQPLSEDNIIDEKRKIEIYRKILENYKGKNILIKRHPREVTDYKKYFPNIEVIEGDFPFELVMLNGKKIKKLITLFSTGAMIGKGKIAIDFYGTEVDKNIYKRFGSMDYIYKTNCKI